MARAFSTSGRHLEVQKWSEHMVFCTFSLPHVLRATSPEPQNIAKIQCFATFLPFRPVWSFSSLIFSLLTFSMSTLSEVSLLNFLRWEWWWSHLIVLRLTRSDWWSDGDWFLWNFWLWLVKRPNMMVTAAAWACSITNLRSGRDCKVELIGSLCFRKIIDPSEHSNHGQSWTKG